jgi:hypothetical protein
MAEFNFHTEARTVVERWGERIKGKTGKSPGHTRQIAHR